MVWYHAQEPSASDVISEKIDDYSVTYVGGGAQGGSRGAYPASILAGLNKYRLVKMT